MTFDKTDVFDEQVKPLLEQLSRISEKERIPIIVAVGIKRTADGEQEVINDTFETCRMVVGSLDTMSSAMIAAALALNEDIRPLLRDAIISRLGHLMHASVSGEADPVTLEAARVTAAYGTLWKILAGAGLAARTSSVGGDIGTANGAFEQMTPDEFARASGADPDSVRKAMDAVDKMRRKGESHKDKNERGTEIQHRGAHRSDVPDFDLESIEQQLRDLLSNILKDDDDKNKGK